MAIAFAYGGIAFQSGEYRITETDAFNAPAKDITTLERARRDGNVVLFDRFTGRSISADGYIRAASGTALREAIDDIKALLNLGRSPLRITEDAYYREWGEAILRNLNISRSATDVTFAAFSLDFVTEEPFAVDGTTDTLTDQTAVTTSFASYPITPVGSYPAYPDITITVNSITATGEVDLSITNPANSLGITISEELAAGDEITIDTLNRKVFLNAELISPEGRFPVWLPGEGNIDYADNATNRDVDILVENVRRWL